MLKIIHEPDQHRCREALISVDHLPVGTVVECDCGRRYIRREDQRGGLSWQLTDSGLRHGYTRHLHPCCRSARIERPPGPIARCGGPARCRKCEAEAAAIYVGATPERLLIDITRERDAARAEAERWRGLVAELYDEGPCHYDHHGYCQGHSLHSRPCPHARAKELLEAATSAAVARDLETGEQGVKGLKPGQYLVVCAEPAYVAHEQVHANGTRVVTIKTRKGDDGE